MEWIIGIALFSSAIYYVFFRFTRPKENTSSTPPRQNIRLTNAQITCMSCASFDKPIYGENPIHRYSQMPNDAYCFSLRTVESLENRGFLCNDGKHGYLLTAEGEKALRSAMGF
jgi:hypothetical protein